MNKALFLDRDGVVNVDTGHLVEPEHCVFVDGIFELVRTAQTKGYKIIIVTNQGGIARGYYTEAQFHSFMSWMQDRFAEQGCRRFDGVYFCPHHPAHGDKIACDCRKPAPKMLLQAKELFNLDLPNSLMIGDKASDMGAAKNAGVGTRIFFPNRYEAEAKEATMTISKLCEVMPLL